MVSRGGRSKGCTQCRRRKVKCDETRPACIRCLKRGVDCDGPRDLQWIHQDLPVPASPSPGTEVASMSPPNELSINAYENSICYTYTRTTLFRGGPVELACNMIDLTDDNMFSHNPELGMLRDAIMSLSTTYFGNRHRDQRIVAKGYNQYGQVLKQLNTALAMPACQMSNEILLTAFTCMLVEMFSPKGPINFLKHQRGIEAMMRLRGPPNDATGDTAIMFRGLRVMSIVSALVDQRPSIYASEPWSNAPIPQTTGTGRLQHDLLTVLASCTQLTTDRNALLASGLDGECRINLLGRANRAMAEVEALYPVWVAMNEKELTKAEKSSYLVQDLAIANHLSATAYMLYHAIRICILQIKQSLEWTSSYVELRNDAALQIARCLELKERERQEGLAPLSTTWSSIAIKVVWQALGGFETEGEQRLYRAVECISIWLARSP